MCHQEVKASGAEGGGCEAVAPPVPSRRGHHKPARASRATGTRDPGDGPQSGAGPAVSNSASWSLPANTRRCAGGLVSTPTGSTEGCGARPLCGVHAPSLLPCGLDAELQ